MDKDGDKEVLLLRIKLAKLELEKENVGLEKEKVGLQREHAAESAAIARERAADAEKEAAESAAIARERAADAEKEAVESAAIARERAAIAEKDAAIAQKELVAMGAVKSQPYISTTVLAKRVENAERALPVFEKLLASVPVAAVTKMWLACGTDGLPATLAAATKEDCVQNVYNKVAKVVLDELGRLNLGALTYRDTHSANAPDRQKMDMSFVSKDAAHADAGTLLGGEVVCFAELKLDVKIAGDEAYLQIHDRVAYIFARQSGRGDVICMLADKFGITFLQAEIGGGWKRSEHLAFLQDTRRSPEPSLGFTLFVRLLATPLVNLGFIQQPLPTSHFPGHRLSAIRAKLGPTSSLQKPSVFLIEAASGPGDGAASSSAPAAPRVGKQFNHAVDYSRERDLYERLGTQEIFPKLLGIVPDELILIVEYCGYDLHEADFSKPLLRAIVDVTTQALHCMHVKFGLVHRDLSMGNILVREGGGLARQGGVPRTLTHEPEWTVKLNDFGLAQSPGEMLAFEGTLIFSSPSLHVAEEIYRMLLDHPGESAPVFCYNYTFLDDWQSLLLVLMAFCRVNRHDTYCTLLLPKGMEYGPMKKEAMLMLASSDYRTKPGVIGPSVMHEGMLDKFHHVAAGLFGPHANELSEDAIVNLFREAFLED